MPLRGNTGARHSCTTVVTTCVLPRSRQWLETKHSNSPTFSSCPLAELVTVCSRSVERRGIEQADSFACNLTRSRRQQLLHSGDLSAASSPWTAAAISFSLSRPAWLTAHPAATASSQDCHVHSRAARAR